jgi:glycosyltransferase involved in cell wall biosynthesis
MKIAIVHDELMRRGGAEQVVRCFHKAFPEAPIYTMAYQANLTYSDFSDCTIKTSWMQSIVSNEKNMRRLFFPLGLLAMQQLDVTGYDVILISSTYGAKYVKMSPTSLVINYCHTPFRLAWYPESYKQYTSASGIKKWMFDVVIKLLRIIDYKAAQRTDIFIANSTETKNKIKSAYNFTKHISLIKPPVNCDLFYVSEQIRDYYLVVSRLESYKKVDLVIDTFNELGYPLIIVGKGSQEIELKKKAKRNITFKSGISSQEMADLYAHCKAFIFPQHEDYGITPLEANASGRPVIAYSKGGVLDTMIPLYTNTDASKATAVFFDNQDVKSLITAINKANEVTFDPSFIRKHAEKFHENRFVEKIREYIYYSYHEIKGKSLVEKHFN